MSRRSSRTNSKNEKINKDEPQQILRNRRAKIPVKDEAVVPQPTKKVKKEKTLDTANEEKKPDDIQKKDQVKQPAKEHAKNNKNAQKQIKKIKMIGSVPVDSNFPQASTAKVVEKDGIVYASTLNQSNVAQNNNKFYIMQVLEESTSDYTFFCRWGRVGVAGQTSQMRTPNLEVAIRTYQTKIRQKINGGYRVVQMNYQNDDDEQAEKKENGQQNKNKNQPQAQSQLQKQVQNLIRLIFDMKMMNNQMKQIGYDAKKMPLGKLSKASIQKGYEALNKLMQQAKGKKRLQYFQEYSNDFYSYIPHDFGFIKMQNFILDNDQKIRQKLEMLQSLQDIQVYTKILNEGKISNDMNQMDSNYLRLKTEIKALDKNSQTYKKLIKYVKNSHAVTHNNYRLEVQEIYQLEKQQENIRYKNDIHNKQLLWHGSRLTNFVGILSQGLRIAPPQAPVTGYMFGKGVYFADMVSKSANYCCTSRTNNTGLMLLCQVALGNCWQKYAADYYASNLPPGMHSTKGVGRTAPKSGQIIDNVFAPNQQCVPTRANHASLLYNQYIVYDVSQIKSKYLFKMKFLYN